jgi:L-fuculose-phosphate aldolase
MNDEISIRETVVKAYKKLEADGNNRGASGNISVRFGDAMLITPTAVSAEALEPDMLTKVSLSGTNTDWEGSKPPSSEWRFHRGLLMSRNAINAVIHTHSPWCTVLAVARKPIPAIHYMIAAFGVPEIPVADYARYGSAELAENVVTTMKKSNGCLLANHGMVVGGTDLIRALWLVDELEALAHQYYHALAIGGGKILSDAQIEETARGFDNYGVQSTEQMR